MQLLKLTSLYPVYLPYDKAPLPFGDPIACTCTSNAAGGVFTVPGYVPTGGDRIGFSYTSGGSFPADNSHWQIAAGTAYYVISSSISGRTFSISSTSEGDAYQTTSTGADLIAHLLSNQVDGTTIPFKTGYTVVAANLTSNAQVTLWGANDSGTTFGNVQGPGSWNVIATIATSSMQLLQLNYDWVSAAGATLYLVQN